MLQYVPRSRKTGAGQPRVGESERAETGRQVGIQEAMGAGVSPLRKYQDLVVGRRGLGRLLLHEARPAPELVGARRARAGPAQAPLPAAPRLGGEGRRLRAGRRPPPPAQDPPRRRGHRRRPRRPRREGDLEPRDRRGALRLPRPRHDPLLQGRGHHDRRPRQLRLPLRGLLRLERHGGAARPLRRPGLPRRRGPRVRAGRPARSSTSRARRAASSSATTSGSARGRRCSTGSGSAATSWSARTRW